MKKMQTLELEVFRFSTEDVIVTSGGIQSSIADPVKFIFEAGTSYFARGDEINEALGSAKVREGLLYHFTPTTDGDTFVYDKNDSATNGMNVKDGYIYVWYKNSGWYTDGLNKYSYYKNGKYDFPTD